MASQSTILESFYEYRNANWPTSHSMVTNVGKEKRFAKVLDKIKQILETNVWLEHDEDAEWMLRQTSYDNLMEAWLQYFCLVIIVDLKSRLKFPTAASKILIRVLDSSIVEARCVQKPPYIFIVLSRGCYELSHARGLLQLMISGIATSPSIKTALSTNYLRGQAIERAIIERYDEALPLFKQFVGITARSNYAESISDLSEIELLGVRENDYAFDDACQEFFRRGLPTASRPLANLVQYFPLLFMLFLLFHELGHIRQGLPPNDAKRSLTEECVADIFAVESLTRLATAISKKNEKYIDSFPVSLAAVLFLTVIKLFVYCVETSNAVYGPMPDVSEHYDSLDGKFKLESPESDVRNPGVWEKSVVGARGQGISGTIAFHYDDQSAQQVIDLFWDCVAELEIGNLIIAEQWLNYLFPDAPLPSRMPPQVIVEFVNHNRKRSKLLDAHARARMRFR